MTEDLIAHVKREEGFMAKVYKCPAGYDTVGYGHRIDLGETVTPPITEAEADALLRRDLAHYEAMALRLSPGLKDEPASRLDAITDFCFNLGGANYSRSMLRFKVNTKKWTEAAEQMRLWCHARDPRTNKLITLPGLVRRREVDARWLDCPDTVLPPAA